MIKELVATLLFSGSIGVKLPIQPKRSNNDYIISGVYNFKETWSYSTIINTDYSYTYVFETLGEGTTESPLHSYRCPIDFGDGRYQQLYLMSFKLDYYSSAYDIDLTFTCYDLYLNTFTESITIEQGDSFDEFQIGALLFYCHDSIKLSGTSADFFTALFTTDDNSLTTTYNGYYSFANNLSQISTNVSVFGPSLFNNTLDYGFTNHQVGATGLSFYQYDINSNSYYLTTYSLPFDNKVVASNNVLLNGVKMTKATKVVLESVGIFAYVRDSSYDNANFHDLLFSVMDSPIYMLSRLLSFDLFGVNLFIAFCGLITIAVLLVLIKKFF